MQPQQPRIQPIPFDFNKTVTNLTTQLNNMKRTHGRVMGEMNQNLTETMIKQYDQIIQLVNPIVIELDRCIREIQELNKRLEAYEKPKGKESATKTSDEAVKKPAK